MLSVIGECIVDLVGDADGRTYVAHPGGSPLNIAVGLARLGHHTALLARLADDAFGRLLRTHAAGNGVDLAAAPHASEPSTAAIATLDEHGRASYDFYVNGTADFSWRQDELDTLPPQTTLLHTGSLAAWMPPGSELIATACERLRAEGNVVLSYDPNVRPSLMGEHDAAVARVERSVAAAHIVKASDEDVAWLYPQRPLREVAQLWLGLGAQLVVVTRGPDGATGYLDGAELARPGRSVQLVDTVGAGDAFMAGLLGAVTDAGVTHPQQLLGVVDEARLATLIDRAILVSAMTCERAGANPPTREEVLAA